MKRYGFFAILALTAALFLAPGCASTPKQAEPVPVAEWAKPGTWRASSPAAVSTDGTTLTIKMPGVVYKPFAYYPFDGGKDVNTPYQGISFRVRGDGSDEWACITFSNGARFGGVYYFPVKSTDWVEYRVAFADMAPITDHTAGLPRTVPVGGFGNLIFGDKWTINSGNIPRQTFQFEVADLKLLPEVPSKYESVPYRPMPLDDAIAKMKKGEPVRILCFGDSITSGSGLEERRVPDRYATLLGPALAEYYKNPNITSHCAATGGAHTFHSLGWIERDLKDGLPDIATMLIGFNNCSAAQTPEMYRKQLTMWIERLMALTQGKCAVVLIPTIPGVPRFFTQDYMAEITREVAAEYGCAISPMDETFKELGPFVYRDKYLVDGIHPNSAGHKLMLETLLHTLEK